jgi:hypothetical protein
MTPTQRSFDIELIANLRHQAQWIDPRVPKIATILRTAADRLEATSSEALTLTERQKSHQSAVERAQRAAARAKPGLPHETIHATVREDGMDIPVFEPPGGEAQADPPDAASSAPPSEQGRKRKR